jgi:hypothetical protein
MTMTIECAKQIIQNAVTVTKPRWETYGVRWRDADRVFLLRAYEQGGFEVYTFIPLLDDEGIGSIPKLGGILKHKKPPHKAYARSFSGNLASPFWQAMKRGEFGTDGRKFAQCVERFLLERPGRPGAFFWRQMWNMLIACSFLDQHGQGSFAVYLKMRLARYANRSGVTDADLLDMSPEAWQTFVAIDKPYREIQGVGPNVFDFLMGDMEDARFAKDCYKFDAANQHFLNVTGIGDLITPFDREGVIRFIRSLNLLFTLREINKGVYTYSSETEARNYGYCRSLSKCLGCNVRKLCMRRL